MRILSQDKSTVIYTESGKDICITNDKFINAYASGDVTMIGIYETEDRAKEILREIFDCTEERYEMPEE